MATNYIQYTSRVKSSTADGVLLEADQVKDEEKGKLQSVINKEVDTSLNSKANNAEVYKKTETYSKSEVDTKVATSVSSVYKPKGSKATIAEVIALTDAKVGDVWDVKAEFTLSGKKYPASTNVVCVTATTTSSHTDANWDALGGTVDLTPYAKTADVNTELEKKVDKVSGKGLSTNDYTTAEKTKLAGIAAGAQANTVTSVAGRTGAVTLTKTDVGLSNVDNTSDASKPISTATQTALNLKANNAEVYKKTETYTRSEVDTKVATSISTVYKPKGSKDTIAQVIALTDAKPGDVWDVKAEFTLSGKKYPASTNVVCVTATTTSVHTDANWDALGGTVDLTPYARTADVNTGLAEKVNTSSLPGKLLSTEIVFSERNTGIALGGKSIIATGSYTHDDYATIPFVTSEKAGVVTADDKRKLNTLNTVNRYRYGQLLSLNADSDDAAVRIALTPIGSNALVIPKAGDMISDETGNDIASIGIYASSSNSATIYNITFIMGITIYNFVIGHGKAVDNWLCTQKREIDLSAIASALTVG